MSTLSEALGCATNVALGLCLLLFGCDAKTEPPNVGTASIRYQILQPSKYATNVQIVEPKEQNYSHIDAFAIRVLGRLNEYSISNNIELCGYITRLEGKSGFQVTRPSSGVGGTDSCTLPDVFTPYVPVAMFHTHSAVLENNSQEIPSGIDIDAANQDHLTSYISTPGGKIWKIEPPASNAVLLCWKGCIPSDPQFEAERDFFFFEYR